MTKYKTGFRTEIETVEIVRETPQFIVLITSDWRGENREYRVSKSSSYDRYHDTWEQARNYLYAQAELSRDGLLERLKDVEARIKEIEALKPPPVVGRGE